MNRSTALKLMVAALPSVLLAACGGGNDSLDDRIDLADPKVRLVHAVPLAPNVTLFRSDVQFAAQTNDLAYKGASPYLTTSTNTDRWDVRTATSLSATVGSVTFDARRGDKYTLIAVPDASSLTQVVLIDDPYNKSIASDNARVRLFNGAFNAPNVDVYVTSPVVDIATVAPNFPALAYKAAYPVSGNDSVELEGGAYTISVTTAGTKTVLFKATVSLAKNADWLLATVPASLTPGDMKMLVVQADAATPATELTNTP